MRSIHIRFLFTIPLLIGTLSIQRPGIAASSLDNLAAKTITSMEDVVPEEYDTVAIWQIGDRTKSADIERLLDKLQLKIINSRPLERTTYLMYMMSCKPRHIE